MSPSDRDGLILEAALEFGADYYYNIRNGTLGKTLYIEASNKSEAAHARKAAPGEWHGLYVVVLYSSSEEMEENVNYRTEVA